MSFYSHMWKWSKIKSKEREQEGKGAFLIAQKKKVVRVFLFDSEFRWHDKCEHRIKTMKETDATIIKGRQTEYFGVKGVLLRTVWWHQLSSLEWSAGIAASRLLTKGDLTGLLRSSVLGCPLGPVEVAGERRMMAKLSSLIENISCSMQDTLTALGSFPSLLLLSDFTINTAPSRPHTHHNWQYQRILNFAISIFPMCNNVN